MPLSQSLKAQRKLLGQILRSLRLESHMSAKDVAKAMGLPLRSYYNFEAGRTPLDLSLVHQFAMVVDCDGASILYGLATKNAALPLYCRHNKIVTLHWVSFKTFSDRVGGQIASLPVTGLMETFSKPFEVLLGLLSRRDLSTERWLRDNQDQLFGKNRSEPD